jgi:hypothetical protein
MRDRIVVGEWKDIENDFYANDSNNDLVNKI